MTHITTTIIIIIIIIMLNDLLGRRHTGHHHSYKSTSLFTFIKNRIWKAVFAPTLSGFGCTSGKACIWSNFKEHQWVGEFDGLILQCGLLQAKRLSLSLWALFQKHQSETTGILQKKTIIWNTCFIFWVRGLVEKFQMYIYIYIDIFPDFFKKEIRINFNQKTLPFKHLLKWRKWRYINHMICVIMQTSAKRRTLYPYQIV